MSNEFENDLDEMSVDLVKKMVEKHHLVKCILMFLFLQCSLHALLNNEHEPHEPQRCLCLRSSSQALLTVPNCKTMLVSCRFSVTASRVWNSVPLDLKTDSNSLRGFKSSLKTYAYLHRRDYI